MNKLTLVASESEISNSVKNFNCPENYSIEYFGDIHIDKNLCEDINKNVHEKNGTDGNSCPPVYNYDNIESICKASYKGLTIGYLYITFLDNQDESDVFRAVICEILKEHRHNNLIPEMLKRCLGKSGAEWCSKPIYWFCRKDNIASKKCALKCGFKLILK